MSYRSMDVSGRVGMRARSGTGLRSVEQPTTDPMRLFPIRLVDRKQMFPESEAASL
jgi:hypothetical protein